VLALRRLLSKNKAGCEVFSCIASFREWATAGGKGQSVLVGGSLLLLMSCYLSRSNGRRAAAERRDAQDEFHSAAQARAWADGDFDADHGLAFDGVGRPAHWGRARGPPGWRRRLFARPCCV
jgi:hypothetical protein